MRLIVHEIGLNAGSYTQQKITVGSSPLFLKAIRPHLYRHNTPAGTIGLEIRDTSLTLLSSTETVSITALDTYDSNGDPSGDAFFHGYIKLLVDYPLAANTDYWIRAVTSGYTFAETDYVGWCNDYDLRKVDHDYSPNVGYNGALDLELWTLQDITRGE